MAPTADSSPTVRTNGGAPPQGGMAPPTSTDGRMPAARSAGPPFRKPRWPRAYSFALVTGALFVSSWIGQFIFQMMTQSNEAGQHGQSFAWGEFLPQFLSATFENWQSEFLQLIWQAAGLAIFYHWGSSQSRESDQRIEAKLDALLRERGMDPERL